jgi:hypothetical protein
MGWAEHRIKEYHRGRPSTWIERRMLEHAQPVHLLLAVFAVALLGYGLWTHDWFTIVGGMVLGLAGHLYGWLWWPSRAPMPSEAVVH